MANTFSPNGFIPVRRLDGAAWTGSQNLATIKASNTNAIYFGDLVVQSSLGYVDIAVSSTAAPTQGTIGVFVGCEVQATGQGSPWGFYPGTSQAVDTPCFIISDPMVVMRVWVGSSASGAIIGGGPLGQTNVGENFGYQSNTANANTLAGISAAYLDAANKGTTNTLPFTIVGIPRDPPGVNGFSSASAGNVVEVAFNQQAYKVGTTSPNNS